MTPSLEIGNGNWAVKSDSLLGYKTIDGKYYPREIGVTRATTATRINADGLVELTPYNLFQYSEQFDNSAWIKSGTISANATTAPNGTLTADTITISSTATAQYYIIRSSFFINIGQYTQSFYVKKNTYGYIALVTTFNGVLTTSYFDINTGVVGTTTAGTTSSITDVGNGWYRVTQTATETIGANRVTGIYFANSLMNSINVSLSLTDSFYAWGAQLNEGTLKDYLPTTDRLDIARIDYSSGDAALLVEPQRTNLALYSEQFDIASWNKQNTTVSANSSISPSGLQNADTFIANGSSSFKTIGISGAGTSGVAYTHTIYAKKNTNNFIQIFGAAAIYTTGTIFANFDLENGVVGSVGVGATASIQSVGDGWYRCTMTATATATSSGGILNFAIVTSASSPRSETNTLDTSVYIWGAQLEAGAYPTSYIPTTSAAVTRNEDYIVKTGVSNLIDGTQGTLFIEASSLANDGTFKYFSINDGTTGKEIVFQYTATLNQVGIRYLGGGIQCDSNYTISDVTAMNKFAYTWQQDKFELWYNGTKIISDTSGNVTTGFNRIEFRRSNGTIPFYANTKAVKLWKEVLTDTELATLTTI